MINKQEWEQVRSEINQASAEVSGELSGFEEYVHRVLQSFGDRLSRLEAMSVSPTVQGHIPVSTLMPDLPRNGFPFEMMQSLNPFAVHPSELLLMKEREEEERRVMESLSATQNAEREEPAPQVDPTQSLIVDVLTKLSSKLDDIESKLASRDEQPVEQPEPQEVDPDAPLHSYSWGGNYSTDAYRRSVDDLRVDGTFR